MSVKVYHQLVPLKVVDQIEELEEGSFADIPGYRRVYLYQILSVVVFSTRKDGEAAALKSEFIQKEVPGGIYYLKALIQAGIVEREGSYRPGVQSFKYCISDAYKGEIRQIRLEDMKLLLRIRNRQKPPRGRRYPREAQTKHLRQMAIDTQALQVAQQITDPNKRLAAVASVTAIMNRELFHTVDHTAGRFHSNFTNLMSSLREYVTIGGKHLVNVDLKNSQPYLSLMLLTNPAVLAQYAKDAQFSMFLKTLEPIHGEDVENYIKHVTSGGIYEYLMERFAQHSLIYIRSEMKEIFFRILFSSNRSGSREKTIFKHLFPAVDERFRLIRGTSRSESSYKNHKRFAILLQTVEAHIILERVLPRIYTDHPDTVALSIHDSVSVQSDPWSVWYVLSLMEAELRRFTRHTPMLKVEGTTVPTSDVTEKFSRTDRKKSPIFPSKYHIQLALYNEEGMERGYQYDFENRVID